MQYCTQAVYSKQEAKIGLLAGRMNAGLDKLDEVEKGVVLYIVHPPHRPARQWRN